MPGRWEQARSSDVSVEISHTKHPARTLHLELLPNCSVTIQTRIRGTALTEKILVPFGAHSDQLVNLLQLAARQVCSPNHGFFDAADSYVDDRRRRRSQRSSAEVDAQPLFKFVHARRYALQVGLAMGAAAPGLEADGAVPALAE